MFQRGISPDVARQIVVSGEVIVDYPGDQPYPSTLLRMKQNQALATWSRFTGLIPQFGMSHSRKGEHDEVCDL